jgi:NADPH:quinone reductase-like Zn-dependent oxidoreductase
MWRRGEYDIKTPPPFIPGAEVAGTVVALGPDVTGMQHAYARPVSNERLNGRVKTFDTWGRKLITSAQAAGRLFPRRVLGCFQLCIAELAGRP